jgi:hypothetical protein
VRTAIGLSMVAAALLVVSAFRAAGAGFTHDEAASYDIVTREASRYANSLNNHLLNTWCMSASSSLFGTSELALRAHTVLAHALYLVCSVLVLRHVETRSARVAGFALLNLNLFVLDYMFLARGYGMAMAFQLLSMLALLNAAGRGTSHGTIKLLAVAIGAAGLAVLANVSFLNYLLPACAVAAILAFRQRSAIKWRKGTIAAIAAALAILGAMVSIAVYRVFETWEQGQLSWGKKGDVVVPVLRSLVRAWIHEPEPAGGMVLAMVLAVAVLMTGAVACAVWRAFRTRTFGNLEWVVLIGIGSIVLTVIQHRVLATALPAERHGLVFVAPWMLAVALALGRVGADCRSRWSAAIPTSLCVAITAVMCVRFVTGLDMGQTYTWPYESNSKDAMRRIDEDRRVRFPDESVSVGITWALEPSMSYYRQTLGYTWMNPLVQAENSTAPIGETGHQYLYVFDWQRYSLPEDDHSIMMLYADSKTVLLRVERAGGAAGDDPRDAQGSGEARP